MRNRGQSAGVSLGAGAAEAEEAPFDINKLLESLEEIANRKLSSPDAFYEATHILEEFDGYVGETGQGKEDLFREIEDEISEGESLDLCNRLRGIFEAVFTTAPIFNFDSRKENAPILHASLKKLEMLQKIFDASPEGSFIRGQLLDLFSAKFGSRFNVKCSLARYPSSFVSKGEEIYNRMSSMKNRPTLSAVSHDVSPPPSSFPLVGGASLWQSARRRFSSIGSPENQEESKTPPEEEKEPEPTNQQRVLLALKPTIDGISAAIRDYEGRQMLWGCMPTLSSCNAGGKASLLHATLEAAKKEQAFDEVLSIPLPAETDGSYDEVRKSIIKQFLDKTHEIEGRANPISLRQALNDNRLPYKRDETRMAQSIFKM